jgi:uncharacterized protein (DUF488 family)
VTDSVVYTIGHSTHELARFLELLRRCDIEAVADVRSSPYSQWMPQFNREPFGDKLGEAGIQYVFLGDELGARRDEPACYVDGQARYEKIAELPAFIEGVKRVQQGAAKMRVALMCAEKDPTECHRAVLVGRVLVDKGLSVRHILSDGAVEEHVALEQRLLAMFGLASNDLFQKAEDMLAQAYERRGRQIAYKRGMEERSE